MLSNPTRDRRRPAIPWGLIGAAALIILVERSVARRATDWMDEGATNFRYAARFAPKATGYEILCLGDSLVKHGVVPEVIGSRLGRRTGNHAVAGAPAPVTYFLLKRALDRGARPAALVVDFKSTQLQYDPRIQARELSELLTLAECFDFARTARDPRLFADLMTRRCLATLRSRREIRAAVLAALGGASTAARRGRNAELVRGWDAHQGAGLLPKNPAVATTDVYWDEARFDAMGRWSLHPLAARYLQKFLALTSERKVPVYWLVPPINPKAQARRDRRGDDAAFNAFLRRVQASQPHVTVVDGRRAGYPVTFYTDGAHLDGEGAVAFSANLAELLRVAVANPSHPRWLELPAYRPEPVIAGSGKPSPRAGEQARR